MSTPPTTPPIALSRDVLRVWTSALTREPLDPNDPAETDLGRIPVAMAPCVPPSTRCS